MAHVRLADATAHKPFFGGTYFPPDSRYGRPGFRDVLQHLARAWKQEREKIEGSSTSVVEQLRAIGATTSGNCWRSRLRRRTV